MQRIKQFLKDESGASMVEYGLMVALIAAVCMAAVATIGTTMNTKFGEVNTQLGG
jgi:pilus assembly protein Flp/PilA